METESQRVTPEPYRRRARRVIVTAGLVFLALQLVVGWLLDRAPLYVRFNEAELALARVREPGRSPDVLVFGSSRFKALLHADKVEARLRETLGPGAPIVTSLAFNGGDLIGSDLVLERALAEGARPKLVIIELTPEWLRYPVPFLNGQLLRAFTWSDVTEWLPELVRGTRSTLVCARIFPVYCYRRELLTWAVGTPPPYLASPISGGEKARTPRPDDPAHGAQRWARRMRNYRVSERAVGVLERLIDRCRDAGIECVFVESPVTSTHREVLGGALDGAFRTALDEVRRERPIEFLDFSARVADDGFHDSTHGNHAGAARFSPMIADEVIAPRWRDRR